MTGPIEALNGTGGSDARTCRLNTCTRLPAEFTSLTSKKVKRQAGRPKPNRRCNNRQQLRPPTKLLPRLLPTASGNPVCGSLRVNPNQISAVFSDSEMCNRVIADSAESL